MRLPLEHFPFPLDGDFVDAAGETFMLDSVFVFVDGEVRVEVPEGFVTDFNSVPRGLWNFFPKSQYPQAGVVHDFLYRYNGVSRKTADQVHKRILTLSGCGVVKRNLAYAFLRAGGWKPWARYRAGERE